MAKTIATITGTALLPGVSSNRRWYKPEHVAEAVRKAQERIKAGNKPMVMLTFHGADDNSREIAASLTDVSLNENGGMDFAAGFTDTDAGWNIARLADTTDGKPAHLKNVSIRGAWTGRVRKERTPDGQVAETADGVDVEGIDFTKSPGVAGAEIKTFDWVKDGATETSERVLITESVQEARLTITEETAPAVPGGVREALAVMLGTGIAEAGTPPVSQRDSGMAGAGRTWADPGYQADKKQRYDITTKAKAKAAYAYLSQPGNAKAYTGPQLKRIMGRIKAALKKFGVTVAAEGWTIEPALLVTEAIAEYAGMDPECAGSYSLSATNGPTTVTVCSYGLDPADLQVILAQACKGAGLALASLDPDMDADIDVPGADTEDDDDDADRLAARITAAIRGESDETLDDLLAEMRQRDEAVTETAPEENPAPEPAAADREGSEAPVTETTTTTEAAATAPASLSTADVDAAVARALAADKAARKAAKAAKKKPAESAPAAPVTETAAPQGDDAIARMVEERLNARLAAEGLTETLEQRVERMVEARVTEAKQQLAAQGLGPGRKGLIAEHAGSAASSGEIPADFPMRNGAILPMEEWTDVQRRAVGAQLEGYVLGSRASS